MARGSGVPEITGEAEPSDAGAAYGRAALGLYLSSLFFPFFELRPNRIAHGVLAYAWNDIVVAAAVAAAAAACAYALLRSRRAAPRVMVLASAIVLSAAPAALTLGNAGGAPFQRISPAAGFWIFVAASLLASRWLKPGRTGDAGIVAAIAARWHGIAFLAAAAAFANAGLFDRFSPYMELRAQGPRFWDELLRHVFLSGAAFGAAFVLGTAGAIAAARGRWGGRALSAAAGAIQNVPSLALFGLLLPVMAALADRVPALRSWGISGIGAAPALLALIAYAVLPVLLAGAAGLRMVDRSVVDAAAGMGMRPAQVLFGVELPLALPSLAAGARTALVQTIGTTTVAALIGAGGMGYFIFQGVGQAAMDMVIIGVVPIVALSFVADRAMARLEATLKRKAFG